MIRRKVEFFLLDGQGFFRAHVWTERGYSSKTFVTGPEAANWMPRPQRAGK